MTPQPTSEPEKQGEQPAADSAAQEAVEKPPSGKMPSRRPPFFALRGEIPRWLAVFFGVVCIALCAGTWWFLTRGGPEEQPAAGSVAQEVVEKPLSGEMPSEQSRFFALRREIPPWVAVLLGVVCIAICVGAWWFLTRGSREEQPAAGSAAREAVENAPSAKMPAGRPPFFALRREIPRWLAVFFGIVCIALCAGTWWFLTKGIPEERIVGANALPSPEETFGDFKGLWFDRALTRNTYASLKRVMLGFGLAAIVGVPLGVLCGCFRWINAFFAPVTIMGRNIPIAALIPLTFSFFGIGEFQKIMFIFIACVAFIVIDSATAVADVGGKYLDTAYTLGANRRQIILKVLVPLALPSVFNSLRLLFGLAFGYIMLAELIKFGGESGGLGDIINMSQRRGYQTHILLVLMIIPLVALAIDRLLFWIQRELFPYKYQSNGMLLWCVRGVLRGWEDFKFLFFKVVWYCWEGLKAVFRFLFFRVPLDCWEGLKAVFKSLFIGVLPRCWKGLKAFFFKPGEKATSNPEEESTTSDPHNPSG